MNELLIQDGDLLRELTSNYYANNDFEKIKGEIELATEELELIVGSEVIELARQQLTAAEQERDGLLLRKVQRPIALLATLHLYQKNDLSHEDDGRKFKVSTDGQEKLPWEWQLDRDDQIHMNEYYKSVDALVRYLNVVRPQAWVEGNTYKMSQLLLVRNGSQLAGYYPVEQSERTYLLLMPFLREAQRKTIQPCYGSGFEQLLAEDQLPESDAHFAACEACVMLALSYALRRLPLRLLPGGIVKYYMAENGMKGGEACTIEEVKRVSEWMEKDAKQWIEQMKRYRDGSNPDYQLTPNNSKRNKYMVL